MRTQPNFARELHNQFGNVIRANALFQRFVVLLGPDANEFVMTDKEKNFSSRLGWHNILGRLFNNGLMLRDFEDHRAHRRVMNTAFKPAALANYMEKMNPVIKADIEQWDAIPDFKFYHGIK